MAGGRAGERFRGATIKAMKRQIHVVYENGVLRPLEPVDFAEKQAFVVTVSEEEVNGQCGCRTLAANILHA